MIKYLGSKRLLLPKIIGILAEGAPEAKSAIDLFSGTSRVGHAMKRAGLQVFSNDHNKYAHTLATCYVQSDLESVEKRAKKVIAELSKVRGAPGFITENYCEKALFFHPKNGEKIDAIRNAIASMALDPELESVLLVSLIEAADRVDSTCGIQMAYLKQWAKRAENTLELRMPEVLKRAPGGKGQAYCLEAAEAAEKIEADIAYLDPPYNQHSYLGNYHIWETLVRWDNPELYGKARKRMECREKKSKFNSKPQFLTAFTNMLGKLRARYWLISFNNEGYISKNEMEALLTTFGKVRTFETDYKRYVGAQIGIYSPKGKKVGKVSHLRNREYFYWVEKEA